jgi:protocatechuate 3,4-dioxygenase beta subunit
MLRRQLLIGAALLPVSAKAALPPTPRQTEGPFYPTKLPLDADNDLVQVGGRSEQAKGIVTHVFGRALDRDGHPLAGARIEIWQCDADGRYHHPADRRGPADPNFQGFGATITAEDGGYRFRTIRPVAYPGRTPHIHVAVLAPSRARLVTQMYVAGEPGNARDGVYNAIRDPEARARVTVALAPAPDLERDALAGRFDIILDG